MKKIIIQRNTYTQLTKRYFEIYPRIRIKNGLTDQLSALREAARLQAFHLERSQEMMKNVSELKKTIQWQDKLIMQLEKELAEKYKETRDMSWLIRCEGKGRSLR